MSLVLSKAEKERHVLVIGLFQPPIHAFLQVVLDPLGRNGDDKVCPDFNDIFRVTHPGQWRAKRDEIDMAVPTKQVRIGWVPVGVPLQMLVSHATNAQTQALRHIQSVRRL